MSTRLIDPGVTHYCALPKTRAYNEHAHIQCLECGKDWWLLWTYAGDSWVDWNPTRAQERGSSEHVE